MEGFIETSKDLGDIKIGEEQTVYFQYEYIDSIPKVSSTCDCVEFFVQKDFQRLVVKYKPKAIPPHLVELGEDHYISEKLVTVVYTTKSLPHFPQVVVLNFKARVSK